MIRLDKVDKKKPFTIVRIPYHPKEDSEEEEDNTEIIKRKSSKNNGHWRRGYRNSEDEYYEQRIKKKMRVEGAEGEDDKSPNSEIEYKTSSNFTSKKGSMHERYEGYNYTEEFPRRSQREKREPSKSFENKIFG